jgi:hypothetical protein
MNWTPPSAALAHFIVRGANRQVVADVCLKMSQAGAQRRTCLSARGVSRANIAKLPRLLLKR